MPTEKDARNSGNPPLTEHGAAQFSFPPELMFRALDVLRLAHIYALKDSHPDELGDDFKPWKWTNEVEFAQESADVYRAMLAAMQAERAA